MLKRNDIEGELYGAFITSDKKVWSDFLLVVLNELVLKTTGQKALEEMIDCFKQQK